MTNIVLYGPPGSGKGTQATKLIEKYSFIHISTGDLLRGEIAANTPLGLEAKKFMDKGMLVPDEVVIGMISSRLDSNTAAKGFIFDGFPRTVEQAAALDKLLDFKGHAINITIALEVSEEELTRRILERGKTSGRADDQDESIIRKRVSQYREKTTPVADYYGAKGKLAKVRGEGSIDEIFGLITSEIDAIL